MGELRTDIFEPSTISLNVTIWEEICEDSMCFVVPLSAKNLWGDNILILLMSPALVKNRFKLYLI